MTWRAAGSRPYSGIPPNTNLLSGSGRGENGVRQLPGYVTKLAAGPPRKQQFVGIVTETKMSRKKHRPCPLEIRDKGDE